MEPMVSLKEHFDQRLDSMDKRFDRMEEKLDGLSANQTSLRVEHVKTGFIATAVVALAEIGRYLGRQ